MRVNKAIEDGSFFENPALRGAFERGRERPPARPRLVRRRPLAHRPPARAAPLRAREDLDPRVHRRPRRVAALRRPRPRRAARRADRDRRRPLLRDGPRPALGAHAARLRRDRRRRRPARRQTPSPTCKQHTTRASRTSSSSPSHFEGRPGLEPGDTAIFFNFRPDRARQLSQRLLEAGFDLTTMTRYRDDLDCPVVFEEQEVDDTLAEVLAGARPPPAARRRDREVRARHVLLQRRPRGGVAGRDAHPRPVARATSAPTTRSRRCPRPRSPHGSPPSSADGYGFAIVNFANPDMVGHTGSIPAAIAAVETTDRCLGEVVDAVERAGGVCSRHRRPRERGEDARARTASARTPPTRRTPSRWSSPIRGVDAARRRRAGGSGADVPRPARHRAAPGDDRTSLIACVKLP